MAIRADSNMTFYLRYLLLGVVGVGWGLYSAYDGLIGYPNQIVRATKYHEILEQTEESGDFAQQWTEYASSQGWPLEDPGEAKTQWLIYFNYLMAIVCIPLGAYLLFCVNRARGRWIESDGKTLRASWGPQLALDQITSLNKRQWRKKGIAKITYDDHGSQKRFVLDDFKFRREPTGEILRQVEARLSDEQITGGPPEPPVDEVSDNAANPASAATH
jgi:hypothetical protein